MLVAKPREWEVRDGITRGFAPGKVRVTNSAIGTAATEQLPHNLIANIAGRRQTDARDEFLHQFNALRGSRHRDPAAAAS